MSRSRLPTAPRVRSYRIRWDQRFILRLYFRWQSWSAGPCWLQAPSDCTTVKNPAGGCSCFFVLPLVLGVVASLLDTASPGIPTLAMGIVGRVIAIWAIIELGCLKGSAGPNM